MKIRFFLFAVLVAVLSSCSETKLTDFVDPFMGTTTLWEKEDLGYEPHRGIRASGAECYPGASMPFGMVQATPVNNYKSGSG